MNQKLPKITIITPSFNQGKFIEQTIKSVVTQNYPRIEYLIMDGGSTDNTIKIIKKYAKKFPKIIKWQSKKDNGQVDGINKGLKKATGDIIAYINSDDYYLPRTFIKVANYFQSHRKCLWVVGNCRVTERKLRWTFTLKHKWPIQSSKKALKIFNTINQPSTFLSKRLVKRVGLFNTKYSYAFDYDYWLRCSHIKLPDRIYSDLAVFRVHKSSKGNSFFEKQFDEDLDIIFQNTSENKIKTLHKIIKNLTIISYKYLKA